MGAQLVGKAFTFGVEHDLNPNEMRLLTWMALRALDKDQPPRYFAAREESAYGLGRRVPDEPAPDDPDHDRLQQQRAAAFQSVKVAIQGLAKKGAIRRARRGREGQRAEYILAFDEPAGQTESRTGLPLESRTGIPHSELSALPAGVGRAYPQGTTEEPQGEDGEDMGCGTRPSHVSSPRDSDARSHRHHLEEVA